MNKKQKIQILLLLVVLVLLFFVNISVGSVAIPIKAIIQLFFGDETVKESWQTIVFQYRIPKALTAIFVGISLSISGLFMQTVFRNPLAGPFVLGISSGASLGVAILILGTSFLGFSYSFASIWALPIAASMGAFVVLIAIIIASKFIKNTLSILIIGLMFGSFTAAVISILSYFSNATQLQQFVFWGFGSLGNLSWMQVIVFGNITMLSILISIFFIKPLNSFLLGENYAQSLGINIKQKRNRIFLITSILTGFTTAFVGPIAFIGIAIPHISRLIFQSSNHKILVQATALLGAIMLLFCDILSNLPFKEITIPINIITSLIGAPIVIWLLISKRKLFV